jgi:formate hydrogenlyase subunit 6/NADH:ubiquinone oxidoreductase subunit I/flavodoxin
MNLIRSLIGRRQFLIALISSTLTLVFGSIPKLFAPIFQKSGAIASYRSGMPDKKSLKGIVVYFSATGNTGKIAGAIYRGMKSVMECDVSPFKKIDPKNLAKYDVIAIGGPIYHFREPAALKLFLYRAPLLKEKLAVLFCTHGPNPDGIFYGFEHSFRKKGATVIGWNDWYGGSYINLHSPTPAPTDGHPDEIDLKEAEIFGREMAERASRIYAGERNLIPAIPTGPEADRPWKVSRGSSLGGSQGSKSIPTIDMTKCVYPRCTTCIDNCVANAIDLSKTASGAGVSGSPIISSGCLHCGLALCIRSCSYDAMTYEQDIQQHKIDMSKCTYPKCTLCADKCPMDTIDFSFNPPVFHKNCEGCDLCTGICPTGAVILLNAAEVHGTKSNHGADKDLTLYKGFYAGLNDAMAKGKFRPLVPMDKIGYDTPLSTIKRVPLFALNEEDFPYEINKE